MLLAPIKGKFASVQQVGSELAPQQAALSHESSLYGVHSSD